MRKSTLKSIETLKRNLEGTSVHIEKIEEDIQIVFYCEKCGTHFRRDLRTARLLQKSDALCQECRNIEVANKINDMYDECGSTLRIHNDLKTLCCTSCGKVQKFKNPVQKSRWDKVTKYCEACDDRNKKKKDISKEKIDSKEHYIVVDSERSDALLRTTSALEVMDYLNISAEKLDYIIKQHLRFRLFGRETFIIKYVGNH